MRLSEDSRKRLWAAGVDGLCKQLGVKIEADIEVRRYTGADGAVIVQAVPVLRVVLDPAWVDGDNDGSGGHSADTDSDSTGQHQFDEYGG